MDRLLITGIDVRFEDTTAEPALVVPLNNLDFQSELAKIASMKPDAVFAFMPGGMGVNLVKQYRQAGLERIPAIVDQGPALATVAQGRHGGGEGREEARGGLGVVMGGGLAEGGEEAVAAVVGHPLGQALHGGELDGGVA